MASGRVLSINAIDLFGLYRFHLELLCFEDYLQEHVLNTTVDAEERDDMPPANSLLHTVNGDQEQFDLAATLA